ncbi:hypothetical protein PpBr36_02599 [Pyricularia pennisetigena]|uniref:hypothetical protein n=1 Tax=Pyricularia pennisetigena TaxID=1578925 RepID=UPI00114EFEC2|nr:hypothetical protein PpBr36_02599 [Pyricularia pennisetigena]TLS29971.1 hypothetical protein PpBr36_02599 [Pyricularia pennisetigena]
MVKVVHGQVRHVDLDLLVDPAPELGRQHAVDTDVAQWAQKIQPVPRDQDQVGKLVRDQLQRLRGDLPDSARGHRARQSRRQASAAGRRTAAAYAGASTSRLVLVGGERGGQEARARVAQHRAGHVEALGAQLAHANGLEAREGVGERVVGGAPGRQGSAPATRCRPPQGDVDHVQHLVLADGLDALAQQHGLDLGVLVQVADLGDHAEPDRGGGQTQGATVAGKHVEEVVGGAVVALGGGADAAGHGRRHEEEVEGGVAAAQRGVQVQRPPDLGRQALAPVRGRHGREERLVQAHGRLHDAADGARGCRGGHGALHVRRVGHVAAHHRDAAAAQLQVLHQPRRRLAVRAAAPEEHEPARPARQHPPRHAPPQPAQAAHQEVALVRAEDGVVAGRRHAHGGAVAERDRHHASTDRGAGVLGAGGGEGAERIGQVAHVKKARPDARQTLNCPPRVVEGDEGDEGEAVNSVLTSNVDRATFLRRMAGSVATSSPSTVPRPTWTMRALSAQTAATLETGQRLVAGLDQHDLWLGQSEVVTYRGALFLSRRVIVAVIVNHHNGKDVGPEGPGDVHGGRARYIAALGVGVAVADEQSLARLEAGTVAQRVQGGARGHWDAGHGGRDVVVDDQAVHGGSDTDDPAHILRGHGLGLRVAVAVPHLACHGAEVPGVKAHSQYPDLDLVLVEIVVDAFVCDISGKNKSIRHAGRHRPVQAQAAGVSLAQPHLERLGGVGLPLPERRVHGIVGHEPADLQSATCRAVLHKLKVGLRVVEQRLLRYADDLLRDGLGRHRLAVDADDKEPQGRLLHHEGARQPKDHGLLRPRAVGQATARHPDQVAAVVSEGLDLGKVTVLDVGEEGVLELHGGDDGGVGGRQLRCHLVEGHAHGGFLGQLGDVESELAV